MTKKQLAQCKNQREFASHFNKKGAHNRHGGKHDIWENDHGHVALPRTNKDYGKGLRHSIIKTAILIGLGILVVTSLAAYL